MDQQGLFYHALAVGMDAELDSYRHTLLTSESFILKEQHTPIGVVKTAFDPVRQPKKGKIKEKMK